MKCPYCGSEMKIGYVQCSHAFYWSEEINRFHFNEKKGDVFLWNDRNLTRFYNENSYLCVNCGKVIMDIDVPQNNEEQ